MLLALAAQPAFAAPTALKLDVRLNGKDVTAQATVMITGGQLTIPLTLSPGHAGSAIKLAPGHYVVTVLPATAQPGGTVIPAQIEVTLKDGQILTRKVELKSLDMQALGKGFSGTGAGTGTGAGQAGAPDDGSTASVMQTLRNMLSPPSAAASATAPPDRLAAFERCAGLPTGFLGKAPPLPAGAPPPRFQPVAPSVQAGPAGLAPARGDIFQSFADDTSNAAANAHALAGDMRQLPGLVASGQWPEVLVLIRHARKLLNAARSASEMADQTRARLLATLNKPFAGHKGLDVEFAVPLQRALLSWKQRVREKGLTPDEIAALRAKGMNDAQIAAWREAALHLPIDAIVVDVMQLQLIERTGLGTPPTIDWQQMSAMLEKLEKGVSSCAHAR